MAAVPYDARRSRGRSERGDSRSGGGDPFGAALMMQPHGMMQQMDKMFNGFFGSGGAGGGGFSPFEAMERSMRDMRKSMESSSAAMGGELTMGGSSAPPWPSWSSRPAP